MRENSALFGRFSHIYVEKEIAKHPRTQQILAHFPDAVQIEIDRYTDVFNRRGQNTVRQHEAQALILAKKQAPFFYEGAPVCQDFGNAHFYYCSAMKNCIYDCSYCYLKGMYRSGHLVMFVNLEDYFAALTPMLREHEMYVCISYDADVLALEAIAGYAARWSAYAREHANLKLEIRTKCASPRIWELPCLPNVIYAFTLSPQPMIDAFEKGTPSAAARIACAKAGILKGFPVRLCFDPMLVLPDWKEAYLALFAQLDAMDFPMQRLCDASVGTFRISQEYLKQLRQMLPRAAAVQYPYVNVGGVYQYPPELVRQMEDFVIGELAKRIKREKIYHE